MAEAAQAQGTDLTKGIAEADLAEGAMTVGDVNGSAVLVARSGGEVFAIDATCSHYGGPLGEGLLVDGAVRCPWHHACFSLRSGEALRAPAFAPVATWRVERRDGRIFVREKAQPAARKADANPGAPQRFVIVGGGGAGFAAAEMLRREGYGGELIMLSADADPPCDRPNLSKDYLAGNAPEDWIPLRDAAFYADNRIDLRLGTRVSGLDPSARRVTLASGETIDFSKLLLATGAEPVRLTVPGADLPHVLTLRSLADCRAIIARAQRGRRAVIVGASFIGLEAAAALRKREVEVHVVAPDARPMQRSLGEKMGDFIRALHERNGVAFHLGRTAAAIEERRVRLDNGETLDADFVIVGIGVRPRLELAEKAGLALDRGVLVDEYLRSSAPDIYAAGDIARWPDPYSGERLRIEHWVVAERQGQTAARNMLGANERYALAPFFWSQHYDATIDYVGHAADWERIAMDGDPAAYDVALRFEKGGRALAVATIFRGRQSLEVEAAMEAGRSP
ncbi:MAG: pyridine nucleotide-disulfide oxidoreductase [Bradyrhizobium sp.]|nr:MAG: pyridine nucleotide-disulfide oxidoreductase [Bradyrhizobium sp.]